MQRERTEDHPGDLIELGKASDTTGALTYGADDHMAGLWPMPGLSPD